MSASMSSQPSAQKHARSSLSNQVSPPYSCTALRPTSFSSHPGSSILIDCRSESLSAADNRARRWTGEKSTDQCRSQVMSTGMLPDDALLEIFDFFVRDAYRIEGWQTLVHVCRRWRRIVFGSPLRLNLRLFCSKKTPARHTLDVWPALPLIVVCDERAESVDGIVAVLERSDRVCNIDLVGFERSDLEKFSAAMQVPFPELTDLLLSSNDETISALPDSFLGGSAPRLEHLWLNRIPFPGLPKLLLSATYLVHLRLENIPHSGYISPEAIVTALSTLTRLRTLWLVFESPLSRPDQGRQRPPPLTRSVLPVLTFFEFKGVGEYLEVVVARIDAPRLDELNITLFNDIIFDTPQFNQFISRTPMLIEKARVTFGDDAAMVEFSSQTSGKDEELQVRIPCRELDWQVSSMEQVCASCLPPLLTLEDLHIYEKPHWRQHWQGDIENALWLELLRPFTSVKNLYLSEDIARCIVPALQDLVGRRATELLPALQYVFLENQPSLGPVQEGIQQFVAVRQDTGHPIAVSYGQKVR